MLEIHLRIAAWESAACICDRVAKTDRREYVKDHETWTVITDCPWFFTQHYGYLQIIATALPTVSAGWPSWPCFVVRVRI